MRHAQCREPPSNTTRAGHGRPALRGLGRTPCAQTPHLAGSHAALAGSPQRLPERARSTTDLPPRARNPRSQSRSRRTPGPPPAIPCLPRLGDPQKRGSGRPSGAHSAAMRDGTRRQEAQQEHGTRSVLPTATPERPHGRPRAPQHPRQARGDLSRFTILPILRPPLPALLGDSQPIAGALSEIPHPLNLLDTSGELQTTRKASTTQLCSLNDAFFL